jgi:nicotinate-nucleotide adenylyltransferase
MAIGLLGGSFNPAHDGHRHISVEAMRRLALDRVWWIVSPGNPLKSHDGLPSTAERVTAAASVAAHPRIDVTGFEETLGSAYTAETLRFVTRRFGATRFVWIMGADNLAQIHRWKAWRSIFALMPVAVADRPGWRYRAERSRAAMQLSRARIDEADAAGLADAAPPAWVYLSIPLSSLSSTELRQRRNRRAR